MGSVTQSLWLPIGRANFFSTTTDRALIEYDGDRCRSAEIEDEDYIAHLNTSVMRRLLEVLPRSFGYEPDGSCVLSDDRDNFARPTSVTMDLVPAAATGRVIKTAVEANNALVRAGITAVHLRVDEHGVYAFTAEGGEHPEGASEALREHIVAVFGGSFTVDRLTDEWPKDFNEGAAAVSRYNGMREDVLGENEAQRVTQPLGILSFFQLNILVEGLCNQALMPSIFFERYTFVKDWLERNEGQTAVLTTLEQVISALIGEGGVGAELDAKAVRRFLAISRSALQRLKRSVGSVRRQLLEAMMGVLHRQTRLIQLDLGAVDYEASPELTGPDPTESQMRGYVMLIAVKMPLIHGISDAARKAVDQLEHTAGTHTKLIKDLKLDLEHWRSLLKSLDSDIDGLEAAVAHDWQERLLYELEQSRSEQEAIAEIERGRRGRPNTKRPMDIAHTAFNLFVAIAGILLVLRTIGPDDLATLPFDELIVRLWPVFAASALIYLAVPTALGILRLFTARKPRNETYSFEFAFRINQATKPSKLAAYFNEAKPKAKRIKGVGTMRIKMLGGWRIEQTTLDRTLMKAHSIVTVSRWWRRARFEIVTEVVARKVADRRPLLVRQCRMFGDAATPLKFDQIRTVVREILIAVCEPLVNEPPDKVLNIEAIMAATDMLSGGRD